MSNTTLPSLPLMCVPTIEALRNAIPTASVAFVAGYYEPSGPYGEQGGGMFAWRIGAIPIDDGGRFIVSNAGGGTWERLLNGATANVKMFGARGDDATDDTAAIARAILACELGFSGELLFPVGGYVVTDTLVFNSELRLRGESRSQSRIIMRSDVDLFRTALADEAIKTGKTSFYYDEDLAVDNLRIELPMDGKNGAALVCKQPGEANSIHGLHINGGGYGIRALGMGTPGLRSHDCTIANQYHAAVQVDGWVGEQWCGFGGPMSIFGLSSDHRRADSDATASMVFLNRCYGPVTINGLKAEGQFGGGLIRYWYSEGTPGIADDTLAAIRITESTYNRGGNPDVPSCDWVVLQSDGKRSASVILQNINPTGVRWLIRDDASGFHVERADPTSLMQGRAAPITYETINGLPITTPGARIVRTVPLHSPKGANP